VDDARARLDVSLRGRARSALSDRYRPGGGQHAQDYCEISL
jgi:hypothetical protein